MSKPPVLFWFENRSHEIREPPGNRRGFDAKARGKEET